MPRRDRPSPAANQAWTAFLGAHLAIVSGLDRELVVEHDLPLAWYDVLVQLHEAGGETTMGELATRLLIAPSSCTRVVERMSAAGLVERTIDGDDHRVRHARLTASGKARLRAAAVTHLAGIKRAFADHLTDEQAALIADRFEAMRRSAGERRAEEERSH